MKRWLFPAVAAALVLCSGGATAQQGLQFKIVGQPEKKTDKNREIIDLLKQVIQKLEAQGGTGAAPAKPMEIRAQGLQLEFANRGLQMLLAQQKPRIICAELAKARAEHEQAQKQLRAAAERLQKLEAAAKAGSAEKAKPAAPKGKGIMIEFEMPLKAEIKHRNPADLEKRLDLLFREMEELRKEIKKSRGG